MSDNKPPLFRARRKPGFTLIEMLVVITIISILSGLVLAALSAARRQAKEKATALLLTQIGGALDRYEQDYQDYPPSDGDLEGIVGAENLLKCLTSEKKNGPYLRYEDIHVCQTEHGVDAIGDEWRHPIRYLHHRDYGNHAPRKGTYRLISAGADGIYQNGERGSDDIVNWDKEKPQ